MSEHVILVAFVVEAPNRENAVRFIQSHLHAWVPMGTGPHNVSSYLDSWWVAEDDRADGSDNDSAVFCEYGSQPEVASAIKNLRESRPYTYPDHPEASSDDPLGQPSPPISPALAKLLGRDEPTPHEIAMDLPGGVSIVVQLR